ncbi:hypothetical protein ACHAXR_007800 [Thalassiosira sp. AJA248-18]
MASSYTPRPPLLPWSASTWSDRWSAQGRLSSTAVPRTPFLLLKAPVSTLYEEKFGGDRNMFTVGMFCSRMMARSIRIGLVVDCTALDLEEFEPLPAVAKTTTTTKSTTKTKFDRRVRYFHNPSEWDDYDVEYHRLFPPTKNSSSDDAEMNGNNEQRSKPPLAPQALPYFYQTISTYLQKSRASNNNNNNDSKTYIALFDSRGGLGAAAYLAASYMCHTLKAPVHAAIEALKEGTPSQPNEKDVDSKSRKWGLCDVRLVKDLQTRFNGRKEIRMEGGTPGWWWAVEEDDENEDDEHDEHDDSTEGEGSGSKKRKRKREEAAIIIPPCDSSTEDDTTRSKPARIGNDTVTITSNGGLTTHYPNLPKEILEPVPKDSPRWSRALTVLAQMTTAPSPSSSSSPSTARATLPLKPQVDISTGNSDTDLLQFIKNNPDKYKVTWLSTKGRRGLLLILTEAVYFIEQQQQQQSTTTSSSVSPIISISIVTNIKFPTPKDLTKNQHRTLLDVILTKDVERNNKSTYRFYALDILCIEGGMVWHKPFEHRWRFLNEGVLIPRKMDEAQQSQQQQHHPTSSHGYAKEGIKIRAKEYFSMKKLGFVMKDVCAGVGHEAEGVRIVPIMGEYGIVPIESGKRKEGVIAVVWRRRGGQKIDDEKLKSLLLA